MSFLAEQVRSRLALSSLSPECSHRWTSYRVGWVWGGQEVWAPRDWPVGNLFSSLTPCTHQPKHSKAQATAPRWAPGASDRLCTQRRLLSHQQEGEGQVPGCVPCLSATAGRRGHSGRALPQALTCLLHPVLQALTTALILFTGD